MFRKIIYSILVVAFGVFLYLSRGDIVNMAIAVHEGKARWIFVALLAEMVYFIFYTQIFKRAFDLVGLSRTSAEITPLVFGAFSLNILAPAAGHAGTVLFADDSIQRKESPSKAIVAVVLTFFTIYVALMAFLIIALVNLQLIGELGSGEISAAAVFLIVAWAPIIALWGGNFRPEALKKVLGLLYSIQQKFIELFRLKIKNPKNWVDTSADEMIEAATSAGKNPKKSLFLVLWAVAAHFINVVCILFIFLALGLRVKYGVAISGYVFGEIARVISPQPEGIGTVEVTMVLIFSLFGIPPLIATTAVVIFRAMNIWLPLGYGFLSLRKVKSFQHKSVSN